MYVDHNNFRGTDLWYDAFVQNIVNIYETQQIKSGLGEALKKLTFVTVHRSRGQRVRGGFCHQPKLK